MGGVAGLMPERSSLFRTMALNVPVAAVHSGFGGGSTKTWVASALNSSASSGMSSSSSNESNPLGGAEGGAALGGGAFGALAAGAVLPGVPPGCWVRAEGPEAAVPPGAARPAVPSGFPRPVGAAAAGPETLAGFVGALAGVLLGAADELAALVGALAGVVLGAAGEPADAADPGGVGAFVPGEGPSGGLV